MNFFLKWILPLLGKSLVMKEASNMESYGDAAIAIDGRPCAKVGM